MLHGIRGAKPGSALLCTAPRLFAFTQWDGRAKIRGSGTMEITRNREAMCFLLGTLIYSDGAGLSAKCDCEG